MTIDYTAIGASIATGILSIGAVSVFVTRYMPKVTKYAMIAKDAVETLADVSEALKDGALTPDEIKKVEDDVAKFKADLKA